MRKVDTAIRVDPLFHKTSAAFDEVCIFIFIFLFFFLKEINLE